MSSLLSSFRLKHFSILLVILLSSACTQIPQAEFSSYREAFGQAREAGLAVLATQIVTTEKLKAANSTTENRSSVISPIGLPPTLKEQDSQESGAAQSDLAMRVSAFDVIGRFNDTLVVLAEGKSPERVGSSFNALVDGVSTFASLAGTAVPGLGLAAPLVADFLELAETARSREEFKQALIAGRPIIDDIIKDVLLADINAYDHSERLLVQRQIDELSDTALDAARSMGRLARNHQNPADDKLLRRRDDAATRMTELLAMFGVDTNALPWKTLPGDSSSGATPYSELIQSQQDQFLAVMEEQETARVNAVEKYTQYQAVLASYRKLLLDMSKALGAVQVRLDAPPDLTILAGELTQVALTVRAQIDALRSD